MGLLEAPRPTEIVTVLRVSIEVQLRVLSSGLAARDSALFTCWVIHGDNGGSSTAETQTMHTLSGVVFNMRKYQSLHRRELWPLLC